MSDPITKRTYKSNNFLFGFRANQHLSKWLDLTLETTYYQYRLKKFKPTLADLENKEIDVSLVLNTMLSTNFKIGFGVNHKSFLFNYLISIPDKRIWSLMHNYNFIVSSSYKYENYIFELKDAYIDGLDIRKKNKFNRSKYYKSYKSIELSVSYMFEVIGSKE